MYTPIRLRINLTTVILLCSLFLNGFLLTSRNVGILTPVMKTTTVASSPSQPCPSIHQPVTRSPSSHQRYYSQFGEDKYLHSKFFNNVWGDEFAFLEMGALDGTRFSNTRFFQETMGWSGYLIEPSSLLFHNLTHVSNRCGPRYGHRAICLRIAACGQWTSDVNFIGAGEAVGGINATMTNGHRERFRKSFTKQTMEKVQCGPIGDLLKMLGVLRLDLFSLDVEGGELEVLEHFDFDAVKVHVLIMERAPNSEKGKNARIDEILLNNGFRFVEKQGRENVVFVNDGNDGRPRGQVS